MYLEQVAIENVGPIESVRIALRDRGAGRAPAPLVVVGENGSGKTLLIASIVDALYEFAASTFSDVLPGDGVTRSYFKISGGSNQRAGTSYGFAVLDFKHEQTQLTYVEKTGDLTLDDFRTKLGRPLTPPGPWSNDGNLKVTTNNDSLVEQIFTKGAYCFFPANRSEPPHWINPPVQGQIAGFSLGARFRGTLTKPIAVDTASSETYQWILDLVLDNHVYGQSTPQHRALWDSVNAIVKAVMGSTTARFGVGPRGTVGRLGIGKDEGGQYRTIAPSLASLSAGQAVLISLFTTIARYGDIGGTHNLAEITGIAVIDEVDLHLHTNHQHDVLPQLMSLFPKVQFILSTHSPLVVLGLARALGTNSIQLVRMPSGEQVLPETFSEFQAALDAFKKTRSFEAQVMAAAKTHRPTVLTEGEFDERYIKKALSALSRLDLIERFDIKWVGAIGPQGVTNTGKSALNHALAFLRCNPQLVAAPIVFLYDCDANKPTEDDGHLHVRCIPRNNANGKVKDGIENALPEALIEDRFYRTKEEQTRLGEKKINQQFDKAALCDFLCRERKVSADIDAADFAAFQAIAKILDGIS